MVQVGAVPELVRVIVTKVLELPEYQRTTYYCFTQQQQQQQQHQPSPREKMLYLMMVNRTWFQQVAAANYVRNRSINIRSIHKFGRYLESFETSIQAAMAKLLHGAGIKEAKVLEDLRKGGGATDMAANQFLTTILSPLGISPAKCKQLSVESGLAPLFDKRRFYMSLVHSVDVSLSYIYCSGLGHNHVCKKLLRYCTVLEQLTNLKTISIAEELLTENYIKYFPQTLNNINIRQYSGAMSCTPHFFSGVSGDIGSMLAQRCAQLKCIKMEINQDDKPKYTKTRRKNIDQFLEACPRLSQVSLRGTFFHNRHQEFSSDVDPVPMRAVTTGQRFERFNLDNFAVAQDDHSGSARIWCRELFIKLAAGCSTLTKLLNLIEGVEHATISLYPIGYRTSDTWPIDVLTARLLNLKSLYVIFHVAGNTLVSLARISQFAKNCPQLGAFYLSNDAEHSRHSETTLESSGSGSDVEQFAKSAPMLDTFVLIGYRMDDISVNKAETLLKTHCPLLKRCYIYKPLNGKGPYQSRPHWLSRLYPIL